MQVSVYGSSKIIEIDVLIKNLSRFCKIMKLSFIMVPALSCNVIPLVYIVRALYI